MPGDFERQDHGLHRVLEGHRSSVSGTHVDGIADPDGAGLHDPRIESSQPPCPTGGRIDPAQGLAPEARPELGTSGVRLVRDFDDRLADGEPGARRQDLRVKAEIHVQLVARERPARSVGFDRREHPDADERHLGPRIRGAIRCRSTAPIGPAVAFEPEHEIEPRRLERLARIDGRSADDGLEPAVVDGRGVDMRLRRGDVEREAVARCHETASPKSVSFTTVPARSNVRHRPTWRPRSNAPARIVEPSVR